MKNTIEILDVNNIKYKIKDNIVYLEDKQLNIENKNIKGILDVSMICNLQTLRCADNQITEIICNVDLQTLSCNSNRLRKIECNDKLRCIFCSHNYITEIICNDSLKYIFSENNPTININGCKSEILFNEIKRHISDIYMFDGIYYCNNNKLKCLINDYFIERFKYKTKNVYLYQNYTYNFYSKLYNSLNEKYN